MAVTTQILRSYTHPRAVMRRLIAVNRGGDRPEARGFVYLLAGLLIIFISQLPDLMGVGVAQVDLSDGLTGEDGPPPTDARLAITLFAWLFVWPPMLYLFAGLSHLAARGLGGKGQGVDARMALFWAVLAVSPLFLLRGMASVSQSAELVMVVNYAIVLAFFRIWLSSLWEVARPGPDDRRNGA